MAITDFFFSPGETCYFPCTYTHGQNVLYIMMFLQLLCKFFTDSLPSVWKGFTMIFRTILNHSRSTVTVYVLNCNKCLLLVTRMQRNWVRGRSQITLSSYWLFLTPFSLCWHFLPYKHWQKVNIFGLPTHLYLSTYFVNDPLIERPSLQFDWITIQRYYNFCLWV